MNIAMLSQAMQNVLGVGTTGELAYTRALNGRDIQAALNAGLVTIGGWRIAAVGDGNSAGWLSADQAVELREDKGEPTFLLVDTRTAGAGMDGIYSAAREVDEKTLFKETIALIQRTIPREWREVVDDAVKRARRVGGRRNRTSLRQECEFYSRVTGNEQEAGRLVHLLGLWPVSGDTAAELMGLLPSAMLMVEKLLLPPSTSDAPANRIKGLVLSRPASSQLDALEGLLRAAGAKSRDEVLGDVAANAELWLGNLRPAFLDSSLAEIVLVSWRRPNGSLLKWSGLRTVAGEDLPHLMIDQDGEQAGTKLELRWKTAPATLPRGSVNYEVRIIAGSEVVASKQVEHSGNVEQKVLFTREDFEDLDESAKLEAYVEISAAAQQGVLPKQTEEFIITFGEAPISERLSSGEIVRCLADGLLPASSREDIETFLERRQKGEQAVADKNGFVACRLPGASRGFRVERPKLLQDIERDWAQRSELGRWVIRCRADGFLTSQLEFRPIDPSGGPEDLVARLQDVGRRFRDNALKAAGTLSRFYLHGHSSAALTAEYLNAWQAALEAGDPRLALAHTVEVQTPGGRTTGLIVLPSHPARVAFQSAYDDLAYQMRIEEKCSPRRARDMLAWLDGAHFPFILPGTKPGEMFVFGDVLGLAAVAMVVDGDREPKSAIAMIAACFAGGSDRIVPGLSVKSGKALAREVGHYLDSHAECSLVRVHALRPGDATTVVRALGGALSNGAADGNEADEAPRLRDVAYQLDLHPTAEQMGTAGAHLVKINQRRRAGVASVPPEDAWSLESMDRGGGRTVPRLRWARRDPGTLSQPAHLAIAFDSFSSEVALEPRAPIPSALLAFGLVANLQRTFAIEELQPRWRLFVPLEQDGQKLANRVVTERLQKIQSAISAAVASSLGGDTGQPVIRTCPTGDDVESLETLHRLCDWVVTVDRNAGVEYFDSPKEVPAAYDAYLIDAVPERDDLGCLQMMTSTAHFDEVRHLLDQTLALMGLSGSMRNCEYLLSQLKGLSGRLAMRLAAGASSATPTHVGAELVALSLVRAACLRADAEQDCWLPLSSGFIVPLDDVRDLVPADHDDSEEGADEGDESEASARRADILFVSVTGKGRLQFRFAEVKYRRHLAMARSATLVESVLEQTRRARERWMEWFFGTSLTPSEKTLRVARLVRALRFYADKALRHHLSEAIYGRVCDELDRLLREPGEYEPNIVERSDRAYIFCPDFAPHVPEELFPGLAEECRVFLFGPDTLPDTPNRAIVGSGATEQSGAVTSEAQVERGDATSPRVELPPDGAANGESGDAQSVTTSSLRIVLGEDRGGAAVAYTPSISSNPHLMIAGLPGMGKTTCLINVCRQLAKAGIQPIVFSYHDDIDEQLGAALPAVSFSDGRSLGFNPMRVTRSGALAHVACAGELRDIFSAIFPDLGELQLEKLRSAIRTSYQEGGWGTGTATDLEPPAFRRFLELLRNQPKPDKGTQTLLARLTELDDFAFFDSNHAAGSLLDATVPQVLQVHASGSEALQRAYASFALYRIYQDMFRRGRPERITHAIIFDEAHRAAKLKLIPTMAKECRKYGLAMIVASQEAKDFDASMFSAIANYLVLRVTDQDARALARNVASSETERRTIDRLKTLAKYEALYFAEGQRQAVHVRLTSA
jgi:hypothetical protein